MGRIPKKSAYILAKRAEQGRLAAQRLAEKNKPLYEKLKPYLERIIDKIDPLETIAVLGVTVMIKTGIQWTEDLITHEQGQQLIKMFARLTSMGLSDWYLIFTPNPSPEAIAEYKKIVDSPQAEILEWMISFAIALIIVRKAGELDEASVLSTAKKFLGVLP